jgi:osmotically-inducible protein OsmY
MSGRNYASALVNLMGAVPSVAERDRVQFDAWHVFGVDTVDDRIDIRA